MANNADQSYDDFNLDELLNMDSSLVMSFLEDSQVEEGDDDQVLRDMETYFSDNGSSEECRFSEEVDDQLECCTSSSHHHLHQQDFEWIDVEMDYSCPSYEATGYFISCITGDMVDVGGLDDYSQVCNGMDIEEDGYIGLWQ
ncbi:hypothetical protein SASPL_139568 [Salvia splendens]|uniref:Uncharacterized protein n=1 Tax=Salvia splendens TaxID=180675 RepID=A0A8X8WQI5_SALSN|nr:hypothetical protein SASPL_139568 [Salvia splendens]